MNNSTRVVVNTGFLYANMLVNIVVQLIAVRLVYNALGEVDWGIFNLIAGVIALFGFLNVAMAAATQRYLSFAIGSGDKELLKETFYYSVVLHITIGVIVLIMLEIVGMYYVNNILDAPRERLEVTRSLFHFITISTCVNIITVPYEADINANEKMGAIALINILDSLMKLGVALYIGHSAFDKLFVYGLLTMSCIVLTLILKRVYCIMHFSESHFRWHKIKDMKLMRSISSFALWNLIGSGCSMARYQGTGMLLNSSFKILINASYGTAQQVNGLLNFFANTIVRAIRPQIVKSEGANNRERMLRLSCTTCKITSLMVALLAVPMYIEMPFILHVWLNKEIPVDTLIFCRYFLVIVFIYQMTIGLQVAIESVGKIKLLQIIVGTMHILALPAGYVCFRLGCPPYSIMLCIVAEEIIALVSRSLICRKLTGLSLKIFYTKTIIPVSLSVILIFLACDTVRNKIFTEGWIEFFSITLLSTTLICLVSYKWILSKEERHTINSLVSKLKNKILKK